MTPPWASDRAAFSDVLRAEDSRLGFITRDAHAATQAAREAGGSFQRTRDPATAPADSLPGAVGLALSGGGIRSATFGLGVLQALADRGLLSRIDYLSTVSGGGYIGSWLSAWIHRTRTGLEAQASAARAAEAKATTEIPVPQPAAPTRPSIAQAAVALVEGCLARSAHESRLEPPEVQWLRRYSNYLTPRVGALSTDALTVVAIWLRNLFLNAVILVALSAALMLLPLLAIPFVEWMITPVPDAGGQLTSSPLMLIPMLIGIVCGSVAIGRISMHLTLSSQVAIEKYGGRLEPGAVLRHVVLPAFVAAAFGSLWLLAADFTEPGWSIRLVSRWLGQNCPPCAWVPFAQHGYGFVYGVLALVLLGSLSAAYWIRALQENRSIGADNAGVIQEAWTYFFALIASVAITIALLAYWASHWNLYLRYGADLTDFARAASVAPMLAFAPPLMLFVFGIAGSLWVGFVGRAYQEPSREWWARLNGWHIFLGIVWLALFVLVFYVPPFVAWVHERSHAWATAMAGTTWLGSLVGALMGKNLKAHPDSSAGRWKAIALNFATVIVAGGIFVVLSALLGYVLGRVTGDPPLAGQTLADFVDAYMRRLDGVLSHVGWERMLAADVALALVALGFAWRVDINRFSLHNMYKNRLTRCYLGASNTQRRPQPFTGLDPRDDVALKSLDGQRPFHILNTAMNLVQGSELAWQQRKAAAFALTPLYCGFDLSQQQGDEDVRDGTLRGFRPTAEYAADDPGREDQGFSIGMAMATSGAAASPNMGFQSTPALAVIMTFFNVRLGRWSPNPVGDKWTQASPAVGIAYLLAELAGLTNERRDFVYLSDGGHFENTAVYELMRRKCSLILMVDAGADADRSFTDLANLQRKVRVDFGYEIEMPLARLRNVGRTDLATAGFELGHVHYAPGEVPGTIILVKPTMCEARTESADLQNYRAEHPDFPQQTTSDQWFDESQFESYRKLGFELGLECLQQYGGLFVAPTNPPSPRTMACQ